MYENCMGNVWECIQISVPQVIFLRSLAHDYCAERRAVEESCDYGAERRGEMVVVVWRAIRVRTVKGRRVRAITGRNGRADGGPYDYGAEREGGGGVCDYGAE